VKSRMLVLLLGLLGSVGWSVWVLLTPQEEVVLASDPKTRSQIVSHAPDRAQKSVDARTTRDRGSIESLELSDRPQPPALSHNLFASYTYEAPRPAPVAVAPEPPHAPPLPFAYTGQLVIEGRPTYLLLQSGAPISVTIGGNIGDFKLVQAAIDQLIFLHGPTGEQVAMSISNKPLN